MTWSTYSPRKKGGLIGSIGAIVFFLGSFGMGIKLLVLDGWNGISNTAGGSMSNLVGWISIYSFLALIISAIVFVIALPVFFLFGSLLGWLYGKLGKSNATPNIV